MDPSASDLPGAVCRAATGASLEPDDATAVGATPGPSGAHVRGARASPTQLERSQRVPATRALRSAARCRACATSQGGYVVHLDAGPGPPGGWSRTTTLRRMPSRLRALATDRLVAWLAAHAPDAHVGGACIASARVFAAALAWLLMGVSLDPAWLTRAYCERLGSSRGARGQSDSGTHPGGCGVVRAPPSTSMARGEATA